MAGAVMIDVYQPSLQLLDAMWEWTPEAWSTLSYRVGEVLRHTAVRTDDRESWARWLEEHHGTDCYFRVCPMRDAPDLPEHRGDAAASIAVPALFADLDVRSEKHPTAPATHDVAEQIRKLDRVVPLSLVVTTGNGWQVYASLDEPAQPDDVRELFARWDAQLSQLGLMNDRKGDLASLMRLPGTVNTNGGATVVLVVR